MSWGEGRAAFHDCNKTPETVAFKKKERFALACDYLVCCLYTLVICGQEARRVTRNQGLHIPGRACPQ